MSGVPVGPTPVALVIDDDEDTVALLQTVLTGAGFQVVTATGGPDGLALAPRHRPVLAAVARRPLSSVTEAGPAHAWAPAAVDPARGAFLHLLGEPEEPDGHDGPEGMRELGMRFVGSWIEFERLRINPSRALVVVDDRLVNALPEQVQLIEATATRTPDQDREWFDQELDDVLTMLGEDPVRPRWFRVRNGCLRLVEPRRTRSPSGDDATAQDDAGRP